MKRFLCALLIILVALSPVEAAKKAAPRRKAPAKQGTEIDRLRNQMRSRYDEVEGIKWIYDKATPSGWKVGDNMFYVYLGQKDYSIWPRFVMGFVRERWAFFDNVVLNCDGNIQRLSFNYRDIERDNGAFAVIEDIDLDAKEYLYIINKVIASKKTVVRFRGHDRSYDFTVSQKQKDAMKRILRLYELRGQLLNPNLK